MECEAVKEERDMPRPKPTEEDLNERQVRRQEWVKFRKEHLFTQVKLAEVMGINRRTVQFIEAGQLTPLPGTMRKFNSLKAKYEQERAMETRTEDREISSPNWTKAK